MKKIALILCILNIVQIALAQTYHNVTGHPSTPGNGSVSIGLTDTYQFIQSHGSQPLKINPLGNDIYLGANLSGKRGDQLRGDEWEVVKEDSGNNALCDRE